MLPHVRNSLIDNANRIMRFQTSAQNRQQVQELVTDLLVAADEYRGFNYSGWLNGGHARWIEAGQPADMKDFIGDTSQVEFY